MRSWMEVCGVTVFGAALLALPAVGEESAKMPDSDSIISRVIARTAQEEQKHSEAKYAWTKHKATDELTGNGAVKEHQEAEISVVPIEGEMYERLVKKDGRPLTAKEQEEQEKDEAKFRERVKSGQKDPDDVTFNEELLSRYRFSVVGEETVDGRPAYVVTFEPKSNNLPIRRRIDRLLNKVSGRIWVDTADYEVEKGDVHLVGEVTAWAGLLAEFKEFHGQWEEIRMSDGSWLDKSGSWRIIGRVLIGSMRQEVHEESSDFHEFTSARNQ
jgi:hypothetical protein